MYKIIITTIFIFHAISVDAQLYFNDIMNDGDRNRERYYITGTMTVLKESGDRFPAKHLRVSIQRTLLSYRSGRDYVQANTRATYHEGISSESRDTEDEIRIYIHTDYDSQNKEEDVQRVKINWKKRSGEIIGVLTNPNVSYVRGGILLTGTFQKENVSYGLGLTITR